MAFSNGGFRTNEKNMSLGKIRTNYFDLAHAYVDHSTTTNSFMKTADIDLALCSDEVRRTIIRENLLNWTFLMIGIFMVLMSVVMLN